MRRFCVCPFKCKLAGSPSPLFRRLQSFKSSCSVIPATTNTQQTNIIHWKFKKLSSGWLDSSKLYIKALSHSYLRSFWLHVKTASVKTGRDNGSFSNIRLQSAKKLFQKGNLENKIWHALSGAEIHAWSIDPSFRINFCKKSIIEMTLVCEAVWHKIIGTII